MAPKRKGLKKGKSGVRSFAETNQIARNIQSAEKKFAKSTGLSPRGM